MNPSHSNPQPPIEQWWCIVQLSGEGILFNYLNHSPMLWHPDNREAADSWADREPDAYVERYGIARKIVTQFRQARNSPLN
jgi:hypothetical protein